METPPHVSQAPWITFSYQATLSPLWAHLGEAYSKCQHLVGTPLQPQLATNLAGVYMRKGALATTAIEGNTLTEEDVERIFVGGKNLPPSQAYLQREVDNVLTALREIDADPHRGTFRLSVDWLKRANVKILDGLACDDHVTPGEYSTVQLIVGSSYKPPSPQYTPYLVDRLCEWINHDFLEVAARRDTPDDQRFFLAFLAAALTHLYIAWIHPFGDGNGRTARLAQVAILASSGMVPWVSTNLLSDFYNRTRSEYYRRLDIASKKDDVTGFLAYSAQGFVDMLREQIEQVQAKQRWIAWVNYVHEQMHDEPSGRTKDRRRDLALAMDETPRTRKELTRLTPDLAAAYLGTERTLSRDLLRLSKLGLIRHVERGQWIANMSLIDAFRP